MRFDESGGCLTCLPAESPCDLNVSFDEWVRYSTTTPTIT
jgi:hypothetical protein